MISSYSYSAIAILALTTTVVAANHHPTHSPTSWQTDFPTASDHHPNLRTFQNTTSSLHDKGSSDSCKDPEAYCGMTIPKGKSFTLKQDLVCTQDTPGGWRNGGGELEVAITVEEGATLRCGGNSIVQLNDEVGKAARYCFGSLPSECGLAWGAFGVELKSGAKVEGCKTVSGWNTGFRIAPPAGGYDDEIDIDNCEATLNRYGLYCEVEENRDNLDFSIKHSNFHHNVFGIATSDFFPYFATSKVYMEDVKSDFNNYGGMEIRLSSGSEVSMKNVEASYNAFGGIEIYMENPVEGSKGSKVTMENVEASFNKEDTGLYIAAYQHPTKVILKGINSFNGNGSGLYGEGEELDYVVSKGTTNVNNNRFIGVSMATGTLTVKGGALNTCGNGYDTFKDTDIGGVGGSIDQYFPTSGKRYTCDNVVDANGFECKNKCPVCD